jgi:pantoate--beta-alanine ligase
LLSAIRAVVEAEPLARLDYVAITDTRRLDPVAIISSDEPTLISMAVFFGKTRLIDNIVLNGGL